MPSDLMVMRAIGVLSTKIEELAAQVTEMQSDMKAFMQAGMNVHIHVDELGSESGGEEEDSNPQE
jgi:hypothetical protein